MAVLREWAQRAAIALSTAYIFLYGFWLSPLLAILYLCLALVLTTELVAVPDAWASTANKMTYPLALLNALLCIAIFLDGDSYALSMHRDLSSAARDVIGALVSSNKDSVVALSQGPPNVQDPHAVDAQTVCPGYKATNVATSSTGFTATLALDGPACNVYGTDVDVLQLAVEYQAKDRLSVNIHPAYLDSKNMSYFILSEEFVPRPSGDASSSGSDKSDLVLEWGNDPSFQFSVKRKSTGDVLFSTNGTKLVYEDQFIEFTSALPENYNIYGLGEVMHGLRLGNSLTRTFYNADVGDPIDRNIYGTHPFYVETRYYEEDASGGRYLVTSDVTDSGKEYSSLSHGVYNRNAHGADVLLKSQSITWRAIGGSIDLFFYSGPSAPEAIASYQKSGAGLPAMHQYYSFGYHQCRWGYHSWDELQEVLDTFDKFQIPVDTIWTDLDYMNQKRDFENDPNNFPIDKGQEFLKRLEDKGQHYIPLVDSAIYVPNPNKAGDDYPTFDRGNQSNSFLLNPDGSLYIGQVWPGYTVYPDFHPGSGAGQWWIDEVVNYYSQIKFSGIWIDMNEPSSFCIGSCGSNNLASNPVTSAKVPEEGSSHEFPEGFERTNASEAASASAAQTSVAPTSTQSAIMRASPTAGVRNINYPPYVINHVQGDLAEHAVCPNATHHDGVTEYDVHNLWGHGLLNATYHAISAAMPGKRPFIIGRSTFVGSGTVAGHWGGDNASKWFYMYFSIPQALSFSIFGIPMFGVDTCGFSANADEELCNRWMQLSAFFPFYRNHNDIGGAPQEPYRWASVIDASKSAMAIRYQLLPYMYSLFYSAHTTGSTVMRALAWEFPNDPSLADADRQFFLGPAVLVTPVLEQGADSVNGVFPDSGKGEVYYDWYTHEEITAQAGENVTIEAPLGHIPVYVRGGHVIPMQQPALRTRDARKTPWSVLVALGIDGGASGTLYVDDGESIEPPDTLMVNFNAMNSELQVSVAGTYKDANPLANITVLGVRSAPGMVSINGLSDRGSHTFAYDATKNELVIDGLQTSTENGAWSSNWSVKWS